jgi:hydroxyacyl-ACP dehydratase HTD2-like protein with hotdog domain
MIKIKLNNQIGIDEEDIALIYKYGIVFLNGTEIHYSQTFIKKYVEQNDLHHLYHSDICG